MGAEGVAGDVSCWGSETAAFASICLVWISRNIASVACAGVFLANSALIRALSSFLVALSLEGIKNLQFSGDRTSTGTRFACLLSIRLPSLSTISGGKLKG